MIWGYPYFRKHPYVLVFVPFSSRVFFCWWGAWEVLQDVFYFTESQRVAFRAVLNGFLWTRDIETSHVHKGVVLIKCSWTRIPNSSKWNERYLCDANPLRYSRPSVGVSTVGVATLAIFLIYHRLVGPRVISISTCCQQGGAHGDRETYGSWDVAGFGWFWRVIWKMFEIVVLLVRNFFVQNTSQGQPLSTPYICVANDSKNYQRVGFENASTRLFTKMQNSNSIPSGSKLNDGNFLSCAETIGLGPSTGFTFHIW